MSNSKIHNQQHGQAIKLVTQSMGEETEVRRRRGIFDPVEAVKRNSALHVSASDPHALGKLRGRLASLQSLHENMRRTNQFLANNDRAGLIRYGYSAEGVEELFLCGPGQQLGYSQQEMSHMAQSVQQVRERIAALQQCADIAKSVDEEAGHTAFKFPQKPLLSVRQLLGQSGCRWGASVKSRAGKQEKAERHERMTLADLPKIFNKNTKISLH
jgi:hypothetical protein